MTGMCLRSWWLTGMLWLPSSLTVSCQNLLNTTESSCLTTCPGDWTRGQSILVMPFSQPRQLRRTSSHGGKGWLRRWGMTFLPSSTSQATQPEHYSACCTLWTTPNASKLYSFSHLLALKMKLDLVGCTTHTQFVWTTWKIRILRVQKLKRECKTMRTTSICKQDCTACPTGWSRWPSRKNSARCKRQSFTVMSTWQPLRPITLSWFKDGDTKTL